MLDYLVPSRARQRLLKLLWAQGEHGSVSELAQLAGLSFASAHKELNAMKRAGLATCTRVGNATLFEAARSHPNASDLRSLLRAEKGLSHEASDSSLQQSQQLRSWLKGWGAPVPAISDEAGDLPPLESVLAQGAKLAHLDASVARSLPVCVWRNRRSLDERRLRLEARRLGEQHAVGFFLELTGVLAGDQSLVGAAQAFRDRRFKIERDFFSSDRDAYSRQLSAQRTPEVARRWQFRMNMTLDIFESTFRKFVPDAAIRS
jgi:hypothetical protein